MKKSLILALLIIVTLTGAIFAAGQQEAGGSADEVKIGFLVKMPEEPWFQNEWMFAQAAGADYGFKVLEIGTQDGEKVLAAIDNIAAQGAQGFVICTPDVKLGSAIVAKAEANKLKVFSVDDRLVGADGSPIESVPHMGISAYEIGKQVGYTMAEQMEARGWKQEETGFMRISFNELPTAVDRTTGMTDALLEKGFDEAYVFESPEKTTDTEGGFNAANITITKNPQIKHWLVGGLNDEAALGAIRAMEGNGFAVEDICGVGIGGSGTAVSEFQKEEVTGFYATALISPKRHGYETSEYLYKWITEGVEPPATTWTTAVMIGRDNYVEEMKANGLWNE
ncbi:MAG: arabinose ABC transporter substrate-binding protein [Spirochaetales bacterium]|uniref:Arabinose ABC transporter substrate-binding protein n=1 Tax=Candidatus Thalassospirochaeta sargassi TaxID=3119039 RepID=A0AAJ1MP37_9SPIO|nr:arabinose ABC transporter substrate-binding protein [Spirochaetales bacterium]